MSAVLKPALQVTIQRERYSDALCQELLPLLHENWVRTESLIAEEPIDPAWEKYKKLDELDMVACFTARRDGVLIGYAIVFHSHTMHHKTMISGHGDLIYVKSERGLGRVVFGLLDASEDYLRSKGTKYHGWFVRKGSRFYKLLQSRGYVDDEIVMERKL